MDDAVAHRQQQVLCDKKWHKLNKRTWLFRCIPFVEFVFGSGSLAIGNVDEESDFDVLIGTRANRIFTARFFCALTLGLLGWRRGKMDHQQSAANKICLNHFVAPRAYGLRLTVNSYWRLLYQSLVPIYGSERRIQQFYDANAELMAGRRVEADVRYQHKTSADIKNAVELVLRGSLGDWLEERLKKYQVRRIEAGLAAAAKPTPHRMQITGMGESATIELPPLIVYTDEELEFHPDPAIIEIS